MLRNVLIGVLLVAFILLPVTACTRQDNGDGEKWTGDVGQIDGLEDMIAQMLQEGLEDLQAQVDGFEAMIAQMVEEDLEDLIAQRVEENLEDLQAQADGLEGENADLKDEVESLKAQVNILDDANTSLGNRVGELEDANAAADTPRTVLYAKISIGGNVLDSPDVVSATREDVGSYRVQFNQPVSTYALIATSTESFTSPQMVSTIAGTRRYADWTDVVFVYLFDSDGNRQDGSFHLTVIGD